MDGPILPSPTVLIVDDCCDGAQSLSLLLACWGYAPTVAYDGAEALRLAEQIRPDVVLLDLAMPKMDGFEVARHLRRELRLDHALLVSMSGFAQADYGARAIQAGCDYHFVKPVEPEVLRQLLGSREPVPEFAFGWSESPDE
jgi:CheY-like chemotaxis protein